MRYEHNQDLVVQEPLVKHLIHKREHSSIVDNDGGGTGHRFSFRVRCSVVDTAPKVIISG